MHPHQHSSVFNFDSSSSIVSSSGSSSGRKMNTLSREGIAPSNSYTRFGKVRRHPFTDQQRMTDAVYDTNKRKSEQYQSNAMAPQHHVNDTGEPMPMFLTRANWLALGDGWYQTTPTGTGSTNRCGLHSVIDSSMGQLFLCVYEPRTTEGIESCNSENPEYDLSVSVKLMNKQDKITKLKRQQFDILFGFKSVTDFFALTGDIANQEWRISRICGSDIVPVTAMDMTLKANLFYDILLQVRGGSISVDIDNVPIFTSIRFADTTGGSLSGILGVLAKGNKFALKGWQLRGPSFRHSENHSWGNSSGNMNYSVNGRVGRTPVSLRDSLRGSGDAGNDLKASYKMERRGPPPVPSGGGGPGKVRRSTTDVNQSRSSGETFNGKDDVEMKLMRCRSLLKERHDLNIVELIMRDIVQKDMGVSFSDIAALDTAKRLLNEAIVLPLMMPELFTGIRKPWKGVLLFGPPGTGKTMLAKAVADLNKSMFFCCSAASLISKFRGESEKIVKCLFEAARLCAPSVVFLDEIDALVSSRGSEGEHEASRRLKTEFFSQMDGISSTEESGSTGGVMVLATTNCPWDLDEAIRRRLEKRIYIPLPDSAARTELFGICLKSIEVGPYVSIEALSDATEGYSGADIHLVCREAAMMPMRRLLSEFSPQEINAKKNDGSLEIPQVSLRDFFDAIENTKSSVSQEFITKYVSWDDEYGSK